MKTYLQWREGFSASAVVKQARGDQHDLGNNPAAGLQSVVGGLRLLAEKDPQGYNFIVSKIKAAVQRVDPSQASAIGMGGRRYGSAVSRAATEN